MVKEKLINDDVFSILKQLCAIEFGEHNILIYEELDAFRELYSKFIKKRLEGNDIVFVLPHYENIDSVRQVLREIEIYVEKHQVEGSLVIIDSIKGFFGPDIDSFFSFLKILLQRVDNMNKSGLSVIVDMGSFYHLRRINDLIRFEESIPAKSNTKSSLLCSYHAKDFNRLAEDQKQLLFDRHYRNLMVKETDQS